MSCEIRFNEDAACERCGKFGAYEFDGAQLCVDCYETKGACCPEFGRDDSGSDEDAAKNCRPASGTTPEDRDAPGKSGAAARDAG